MIAFCRYNIATAKKRHDKEYIEYEWDLLFLKPAPKTNDDPFYPTEENAPITKLRTSEMKRYNTIRDNLIPEGKSWSGHDIARFVRSCFCYAKEKMNKIVLLVNSCIWALLY